MVGHLGQIKDSSQRKTEQRPLRLVRVLSLREKFGRALGSEAALQKVKEKKKKTILKDIVAHREKTVNFLLFKIFTSLPTYKDEQITKIFWLMKNT